MRNLLKMPLQTVQVNWRSNVSTACRGCRLQARCFLATRLPDEDGDCAGVIRRRFPLAPEQKLYHRNANFTSLFQVCSGSLKTQRETFGGGLVVTGFYLPGDIAGIEAIGATRYPSDALATTDAEVCQLDVERLLSHCATKPELHAWINSRIGCYMRRKDNDMHWSTGLQSSRRVLRFFLDLRERLDQDPPAFRLAYELPMRKQDIARYLHITPETLSRNLAQLRREGLLHLDRDHFSVPDFARAQQVAQL